MPTYVYQCQECAQQTEVIQRVSEAPLTTCEACGGNLQKQVQPVAAIYNCRGFHNTDYPHGR